MSIPKKGRGGRRAGAGRPKGSKNKKKKKLQLAGNTQSNKDLNPLEYMLAVMRDETADPQRRDRAAISAAQYVHPKAGRGKKENQKDRAARAASKFPARKAPRILPFRKEKG